MESKEKDVYRIDATDYFDEGQYRVLNYKSSPHKMYVPIENILIYYSCNVNPYVLPIALYSWAHAQFAFNRYVETSISMIQQTLAPHTEPSRMYGKIKETLEVLWTGSDDFRVGNKEFSGIFPQIDYKVYFLNIKPTTMLQYYSHVGLKAQQGHVYGYTLITADEYYYLLESVTRWNNYCSFAAPVVEDGYILSFDCAKKVDADRSPGAKKKLDFCTILNLYCYLKMQIKAFDNIRNSNPISNQELYMREGIQAIAEKLGKTNRTITRYIQLLVNLGMIGINGNPRTRNSGDFIANVPTKYWLSDSWIDLSKERGLLV